MREKNTLDTLLNEAHAILKCHYRTNPVVKAFSAIGQSSEKEKVALLAKATLAIADTKTVAPSQKPSFEVSHREFRQRALRFLSKSK